MNRTFTMKAEELRIGNHTDKGVIKSFYECGIHVGYGKTYSFNELNPIPLTEQWLIDFGFENNDFGNFEKTSVVIWFSSYSNCYVFRFGHQNEIPVKSVHQLQNLYFALTGEDLHL